MQSKPPIPAERLADIFTYTLDDIANGTAGVDVIRDYVRITAEFIRDGKPLPEKLRAFIAQALFAIADGKDANQAFTIEKGSRRKSDRIEEMKIAYAVFNLIEMQTTKPSEAYEIVAKAAAEYQPRNKNGRDSVRKIYKKYEVELRAAHGITRRKVQ